MSAHAVPAPPSRLALRVRGRSIPVVLPKLTDPRLHLAAVITSLQVIGQLGFHFQVSIAQILLAVGTAFVLRMPNTQHGDWWSMDGWWIYVATAAVAVLSKYVIRWRGEHVFNPSNF